MLLIVIMLFGLAATGRAAEVVQNGGFDNDAEFWRFDTGLDPASRLVSGAIDLDPSWPPFYGTVIQQPLNVGGVGGQAVTITMDVKSQWGSQQYQLGSLEYVDTSDALQYVSAMSVTANGSGMWMTVTNNITLPADARKLTRLNLWAADGFSVDNVSVSGPALTPGPIPMVTGILVDGQAGSKVAFGSDVSIQGTGFGTIPDVVSIGGSTNGLAVQSWADNLVEVSFAEPAIGGGAVVEVDFTGSLGEVSLRNVSPTYSIYHVGNSAVRASRTAPAILDIALEFQNGFEDVVNFSVPEDPGGLTSFAPDGLSRSGGTTLTIDTSTLPFGEYEWHVRATTTNAVPRQAAICFSVLEVASVTFSSAFLGDDLQSLNLTQQGELLYSGWNFKDATGSYVPYQGYTVTSTDSNVFEVVLNGPENAMYTDYFAVDNGTADMELRDSSGTLLRSIPVTVSGVPSTPKVTAISITPSQGPNTTNLLHTFDTTLVGPQASMYTVHDGGHREPVDELISSNTRRLYTFHIAEGYIPGSYLHRVDKHTSGYPSTILAERVAAVRVVDAPTHGRIDGHFANLAGEEGFPDYDMEFYSTTDSTTPLFTRHVREYEYIAPYIPPGSYRIRIVSSWPEFEQWYPVNSSFDEAEIITVSAGQKLEDINFHFGIEPETYELPTPQNLVAGDGVDPGYVDLSWDSVTNALTYTVWRDTQSALASTSERLGETTGLTFQDTSAVPDTVYTYRVRAWSNDFSSAHSVADTGYITGGTGPEADLVVRQWADPDPVTLGMDELTYLISVSNAGPQQATSVLLTDTLPPEVMFIESSTGTYASGTHTLSAGLGTLASGEEVDVLVVGLPDAAGLLTNIATVSAAETDPVLGNNSSTLVSTASVAVDGTGNNMADAWELLYWPGAGNDPMGNEDGDDDPNHREFVLNHNPKIADEPFTASLIQGGHKLVCFMTSTSRIYQVQWSTNMVDDIWSPLEEVPGTGSLECVHVPETAPYCTYRVRVRVPGTNP